MSEKTGRPEDRLQHNEGAEGCSERQRLDGGQRSGGDNGRSVDGDAMNSGVSA
jgi:hypothetical protein